MPMHDISPGARAAFVAVVAWSLAWKGVSMWRAARNGSKPWFAGLLVTSTMGVLDAVYLFGIDRRAKRADLSEKTIRSLTGEPEQGGHAQET